MKANLKKFPIILGGFLCLLFSGILMMIGCSKNADKKIDPGNVTKVVDATAIAGKLHNSGLDYVARTLLKIGNQDKSFATSLSIIDGPTGIPTPVITDLQHVSAEAIAQSALAYVAQTPAYTGITLDHPAELNAQLGLLNADFSNEGMQNAWDTSTQDPRLNGLTTFRESTMVSEIQEIFNDVYSQNLSNDQVHDLLKTKLLSLRQKYANLLYNENEGELFNGIIDIALNSNDYWHNVFAQPAVVSRKGKTAAKRANNLVLAPINKELTSPAFIQADCIGYISGWVSALWSDYNSAGGVRASGQRHRIGQGLIWGLSASSFGLLRMAVLLELDPAPAGPVIDTVKLEPFPKAF